MREAVFAGGSYCDNLPSGEYAVYLPAHSAVETHFGAVASPEILFPRITNQPRFKIAAKTQSPGNVIGWPDVGGGWLEDPRISHGVQGHIWRNGVLEVIEPGEHIESQGYRYVAPDGSLIGGSPTISALTPFAHSRGVTRLAAWTDLDDGIFVGQSDVGGVVFQKAGKHYVLIEGHWEFVQAKRLGNLISIAAYESKLTIARLWWLDVGEIDTLSPLAPVATPDPVPVPVPQPPTPEPDPVPELPESLLSTVEVVWSNRKPNRGVALNEIAWLHREDGWGLSRKAFGHFVESPVGQIASDILHHKPSDTIWDVFTDTGVIWAQAKHHNNPDRPWVAPVQPDGATPDPEPEPDTLTPRVEALERQVGELRTVLAATFAALESRVKTLEVKPDPVFTLPEFIAEGKSRTAWGHQHDIKIEVKVKP
jgi:hypothetical protein